MVPLLLLVRDVDDEPEFVATSGAVGHSFNVSIGRSSSSPASGLVGHRFERGHFIDLDGTQEGVTLWLKYRTSVMVEKAANGRYPMS